MLVYVCFLYFDLFEFSAAILEKGLFIIQDMNRYVIGKASLQ